MIKSVIQQGLFVGKKNRPLVVLCGLVGSTIHNANDVIFNVNYADEISDTFKQLNNLLKN